MQTRVLSALSGGFGHCVSPENQVVADGIGSFFAGHAAHGILWPKGVWSRFLDFPGIMLTQIGVRPFIYNPFLFP